MRGRFQTSANHMMLNINLWSTLVLGLGESAMFSARPIMCTEVSGLPPISLAGTPAGREEKLMSKITLIGFSAAKVKQDQVPGWIRSAWTRNPNWCGHFCAASEEDDYIPQYTCSTRGNVKMYLS